LMIWKDLRPQIRIAIEWNAGRNADFNSCF